MIRKLTRDKKRNDLGFSMIELMAVVIIIGMLSGLVGMAVMGRLEKAKLKTTQVQINQLSTALDQFKMDNGFYPSTEQGLESLIDEPTVGRSPKNYQDGGYLSRRALPKDPWSMQYNYRQPGIQNQGSFDLWSNGPDEQEGTEDDINNWVSDEDKQ